MALTKVANSMILGASLNVQDFGATGDGVTDDTAAINAAIAHAQASGNTSVVFGAGIFVVSSSITITGANKGISIIGSPDASLQQGSAIPTTTIRWTGAATPVFVVENTFTAFYDLAIQNRGTATTGISYSSGGGISRVFLHGLSIVEGTGDTAFSASFITLDAEVAYMRVSRCEFIAGGTASRMIHLDQQSPASGTTTIHIHDNIFDVFGDCIVFENDNGPIDLLSIHNNTFNAQGVTPPVPLTPDYGHVLVGLDLSGIGAGPPASPADYYVSTLLMYGNEFDLSSPAPTARFAKLTRTKNANIYSNQITGAGGMTAIIDVVNSNVTFNNNYASSVNGPLLDVDATSKVFIGPNEINPGNVQAFDDAAVRVLAFSTSGTPVPIKGNELNPQGSNPMVMNATNNANIEIYIALHGHGDPGFMSAGTVFTVTIQNTSGGVMGDIVFDATYFRLSGTAFTKPASANNRSITFLALSSTQAIELYRTAADVQNF